MPLTPYDIHNKEFKKVFRGYDIDEVDDFLDHIIRDFELLTREKLEFQQQTEDLQAELDRVLEGEMMLQPGGQVPGQLGYGGHVDVDPHHTSALSSMEQSIHKSIRVAQEVADEVRINAKKEAELVVQEAEKNADRIVNEALQKARAIHSELVDLKQKSVIYRSRFRTIVQSHLDVLDNSSWDSLEELENTLEEKGKQLEEYVESSPSPVITQEETSIPEYTGRIDEVNVLDEVAASFEEEPEPPRQEMRRSSRKLKKKMVYK